MAKCILYFIFKLFYVKKIVCLPTDGSTKNAQVKVSFSFSNFLLHILLRKFDKFSMQYLEINKSAYL